MLLICVLEFERASLSSGMINAINSFAQETIHSAHLKCDSAVLSNTESNQNLIQIRSIGCGWMRNRCWLNSPEYSTIFYEFQRYEFVDLNLNGTQQSFNEIIANVIYHWSGICPPTFTGSNHSTLQTMDIFSFIQQLNAQHHSALWSEEIIRFICLNNLISSSYTEFSFRAPSMRFTVKWWHLEIQRSVRKMRDEKRDDDAIDDRTKCVCVCISSRGIYRFRVYLAN